MQLFVLSLIPLAALVLLLVLIAKVSGHSTRIGNVEWHIKSLQALERRVEELNSYVRALKDEIEELKSIGQRKKEAPPKTTLPVATPAPAVQSPPPAVLQIPQPPERAVQSAPASRTREEWEALIGGKLFNRIGALALIIGIGYFLKYAFDNNWISETVRVLIGAVVGFACLAGGYQANKKGFQVFAQGLVGAGIAILYLAVYAAFNFYHLLPQWVAFVFMSVVTLIAFLNGLFYNSLAEGILGWTGGFLTPLLLSTGQANEIGLFSYIVLLDAGLLAMVVKKREWWVLEPLTFAGTWLMYIMWRDPYYTDADLWVTVFFVTLFWLLFLGADVLRWRKPQSGTVVNQILPGFNAFFYYLAVYFLINEDHHAWMGLVALAIGAVYFLIYAVRKRREMPEVNVGIRMVLTTATLVVIATGIQFHDFDTVMAWSAEAAFLIWLSRDRDIEYLDLAGLALFGLAVFKLVVLTDGALAYVPISEFTLLFNHRALTFVVTSLALGVGAYLVDRQGGGRKEINARVLHSAWCAVLFLLVTTEIYDYFRMRSVDQPFLIVQQMSFLRLMTFSVAWISLSLPLLWVGLRKALAPPVVSALSIALLAVVFAAVRGIAFDPIESYSPVFNVRAISLLLVGTGLLLQTQLIQRTPVPVDWLGSVVGILRVAIMIIVLVLLTGETRDYFQKEIAAFPRGSELFTDDIRRLANMQQLMLSAVWLVYSAVLMSVGIWRKNRMMRFAAISLFGITILKIFLYDLSFLETIYRLFSIGALGLILLGVSWAYQRYKDVILGKTGEEVRSGE